jgi:hypothetical protein
MGKQLLGVAFGILIVTGMIQIVMAAEDSRGITVLRETTQMPDGRYQIGGLIVQEGTDGREAKIKVFDYDKGEGKFISLTELSETPIGAAEFPFVAFNQMDKGLLYYGVSTDNKLIIYLRPSDDTLRVIQELNGNYAVKDIKDESEIILVAGEKTGDGRIRVKTQAQISETRTENLKQTPDAKKGR